MADLADFYAQAIRSRVLDDHLAELSSRSVLGMFSPARGAEAHLYGTLSALQDEDWLFGDLRTGRLALERGLSAEGFIAQLLGGVGAAHAGHATPGEVTWRDGNVVSTSSLLGTQMVHASGAAQGMKARGANSVAVAWFGPGAAATGDAHCAFNFAGVYKLPVVFVYVSAGDADAERISGSLLERGDSYGVAAVEVASDFAAIADAVGEACERARGGGGATIIDGRAGDAVPTLEAALTASGMDVAGRKRGIESTFHAELKAATDAVLAAGPPGVGSLFDGVFAEPGARLDEQRAGLEAAIDRFSDGTVDWA